ncbi:MAG: hypothetical protein LRY69_01250 [Gammaproteobacteria bacterium]|nr:hypothetical protein [Gammaproteobacteria bacterium]
MALSKNEPVFLVVAEVKYGYGFLLIQFDFFGRQQWVKANIDSLSPRKIISTNDNHYFITGDLVLSYYNSIFLLKLDKRGNALWETILYGSVPYTSYGVAELVNGKIVIVGMIESYTAGCSAFIGLVDTAGNLLSANILFTDSMTADNRVYDVTSTDDGGFIVSGYFSEDYDRSAVTLKFNSQAQFDTTMLPSGVIWQDITHLTQQIRKSFILENMSFLLSHDFRFLLNSTTGPDTDPLNLLCNNTANNASNNKPTSHFLLKNKIIIGLTVSLLALGLIGYFGRNPERKKTQKTEEKYCAD